MFNIFMPMSGEADYIVDVVTTEEEAKEVCEFWKFMLKDDWMDDDKELYYSEITARTVADVTTRLDRNYGKRNDAWCVRHDAR